MKTKERTRKKNRGIGAEEERGGEKRATQTSEKISKMGN